MCINCLPIGIQRSSTSRSPAGLGLLEESEEDPDIPQGLERIHARIGAHGERDPARRAEQVAENRDRVTLGFSKSSAGRRTRARGCRPRSSPNSDRSRAYALELGRTLELGQEIS